MSDILINGITYNGINSVQIPLASGDGNATYSEGGGSGNAVQIGSATPVPNLLNLFHALETGACVKGEFTATKFTSTDEQLMFDSGLDTMNGFLLVDADGSEKIQNTANTLFSLCFLDGAGNELDYGMGLTTIYSAINKGSMRLAGSSLTSARVDGGKLYVTPKYENNANYNVFVVDHKYIWLAW